MIYEVRTYDLKPGSRNEVLKRFGEAYEQRKKYSELAAFFRTDIGPLNQIIHIWPYQNLEERGRIRAAAVKDGVWPPKIAEFTLAQQSDIFVPAPFSPAIKPGRVGPYFEIRTYTYATGMLPRLLENWEKALPPRLALSPLLMCGHSDLGALNRWIHIWPYATLDERNSVRDRARDDGIWPTAVLAKKEGRTPTTYLRQESKIAMPSKFSPVQ